MRPWMRRAGRLARHLPTLLGVGLLVGAVWVVWREFKHLKPRQVGEALHAIPVSALVWAGLLTFVAYFVLTFYDRLGTRFAGRKVSFARVSLASFCAYALSHNIGMAAVSGAAVRYRLYSAWGLAPGEIARVIAFCSLTFGLGGMVLGGVILWGEPGAVPLLGAHVPHWALTLAGLLMWAIVLTYLGLARFVRTVRVFGRTAELPSFPLALGQVVLAAVDVAVTASIFYVLLPAAPGLTWAKVVGCYLASYSAGLLANVPGGLGVFDGAMLIGLQGWLSAPSVLGAIVVFRLYYYVVPLFIAGALFAGNEVMLRGRAVFARATGPAERWSEPDFAVAAVTGAVGVCGAVLLGLGFAAEPDSRSFDVAEQAGQFIPSLLGACLLVVATGLGRRVNLAWGTALALLSVGAAFLLAHGETWWVVLLLVAAAAVTAPFRSAFYRHPHWVGASLNAEDALPLLALVACALTLAGFERHIRALLDAAWWEVIVSPEIPLGLRVAVALSVALGLFALYRLVRPGHVRYVPWGPEARWRLSAFGKIVPLGADGVVVGEAGRSAVPFRRLGRIVLALGDPVGDADDAISTVWRLRDLARQEGRDPAVWNATGRFLNVYGDLGLTALPLTADGRLIEEGDASRATRFLVCQAERDLKLLRPMLPGLSGRGALPKAEAAD